MLINVKSGPDSKEADAAIVLPELPCPFPLPATNPSAHFAASSQDLLAMLDRVDPRLRNDPMLDDARPTLLAQSGFPDANQTGLTIAMAWFAWFFFHDDWCSADNNRPPRPIGEVLEFHDRALQILRGGNPRHGENPLLILLCHIRQAITAYAPEWDMRRLCDLCERWLAAAVWEMRNSRRGHVPSLVAYSALRAHDAAALVFFELLMLLDGVEVPARVREHPAVEQLFIMAGNYCSWANDLVSFPKEYREGATGNLVIVLHKELRCTLQEAVDAAARMCQKEADAYVELKAELPHLGVTVDDDLGHQLLRLEQWQALSSVWLRYDLPRYNAEPLTTSHTSSPDSPLRDDIGSR